MDLFKLINNLTISLSINYCIDLIIRTKVCINNFRKAQLASLSLKVKTSQLACKG